ncbi:hypothetical protein GCM10023093_05180 [Nemorincola caseinilytica]|uniref:histidine kinase n=1 Tax=Nemorincola caseinilytica TaxID=2054315 RepID=A0ABP8N631_9BACT
MIIRSLIQKDYITTGPYASTQSVKDAVIERSAVVVMENGTVHGILTATDLLSRPHNLVIDCISPKPTVTPTHSINEVLYVMRGSKFRILPVCENNSFVGLISYDDLIEFMSRIIDEQKTIVQSIAHDLKNPISSIMGLSSLLRSNLMKEENIELLDYTDKACQYASEIINDLLLIPQLEGDQDEKNEFELTEINSFLEECLESMHTLAESKNIVMVNELAPEDYFLPIHRSKLKRAINNLISNGIKFTPENGTIGITSVKDGNELLIKIKDSGIGIPLSTQPYIFNKFTKAKRMGTKGERSIGMGLYITKQIIEQHDGFLWFQSAEKAGTTFFIQLGSNQQN